MFKDVKFYRYLALSGFLGLLVWMTLWQFVFEQDAKYGQWLGVALYVVPLLFPFWGIVKGKPYTHAWANFVVLLYFLHSLTVMYAEPSEFWYGVVELILATMMFVGCSLYARLKGRELGIGLKKLKEEMQEEKQRYEGD